MTRRNFMGLGAGALLTSCMAETSTARTRRTPCSFKLGVAGYTYYNFSLDETLAQMERFDVHGICAKDRHFPFSLSAEGLKKLVRKCDDRGVKIYGAGPVNIASADEAKKMFDYAAALGVKTLVGVPWRPAADGSKAWGRRRASRELCEVVSGLCSQYDIRCAIHNHGRNPMTGSPDLYGAPCDTWEFVKDLDPRMGICLDVAYTFADGFDPAEVIRMYRSRLFDVHLRDIADPANGSSGALPHRGHVDYVSVFRALREVGYSEWCGLELAAAFAKPNAANPGADPSWIPQNLGYFRGLMDAI